MRSPSRSTTRWTTTWRSRGRSVRVRRTAATPTSKTGTVVIPAGQTSKPIPVDVTRRPGGRGRRDRRALAHRRRLGLTIDRAQAIGTIVDDDAAPVVSVEDRSVERGRHQPHRHPGDVPPVEAERQGGRGDVHDRRRFGRGRHGLRRSTATIRFEPGETEDVVHLAVNGDAAMEPTETFEVKLTEATNAAVGAGARCGSSTTRSSRSTPPGRPWSKVRTSSSW